MHTILSSLALPAVHIAERWATFYNAHGSLQTLIAFAHVGGLLVAGGLAIASDRTTMRAMRGDAATRRRALEELQTVHGLVLSGLAVVAMSGVLLFAADLGTFLTSPLFWTKIALVVLLLANGARLTVVERRLLSGSGAQGGTDSGNARHWRQMRMIALASIALWLATTFAGTLLVNAAS